MTSIILTSHFIYIKSNLFLWIISPQDTLSKLSPVAYIDILEGDAEGHIRFHSPEEARAVSDARAELQKEHSWKLEILSGELSSQLVILVSRPVWLEDRMWMTELSLQTMVRITYDEGKHQLLPCSDVSRRFFLYYYYVKLHCVT